MVRSLGLSQTAAAAPINSDEAATRPQIPASSTVVR